MTLEEMEASFKAFSMTINKTETKGLMESSHPHTQFVCFSTERLESVDVFIYLGSRITILWEVKEGDFEV